MKKYLSVFLVGALMLPSIVFASWWNPFTWKIFQHKTETKITTQPVAQETSAISTSGSINSSTQIGDSKKQKPAANLITAGASQTENLQYAIQKGDTFAGIALKFKTTVANIIALNGLTTQTKLTVGQVLMVPNINHSILTPKTPPIFVPQQPPLNVRAKIYADFQTGAQNINANIKASPEAQQYESIKDQLAEMKTKADNQAQAALGGFNIGGTAQKFAQNIEYKYQQDAYPLQLQQDQLSLELNKNIANAYASFEIKLCDTNPEITNDSDKSFCYSLFK